MRTDSARQKLQTALGNNNGFKKIRRMGVQKIPIQKICEINTSSDSVNVDFLGSNRQFDWIEKSDKHTTIYDIYNSELASQTIKTLQLTNFTESYRLTNEKNIQHRQLDVTTFIVQAVCCSEL